jgi:GNAT superfamily N-acetyltransferase
LIAAVTILPAESDAELLRSLEVYNAVHPADPSSLSEARETERQSRRFAAFVAELDGELAGGAHVRFPTYSETSEGSVYVLEAHRRRGVGQRLLDEITAWAAAQNSPTLSCWVADDDPESLAWAARRGFAERSRQAFVELDLGAYEPRAVAPPRGVEITTWAERPELTRGLYDVAREALPDIPDSEDEELEPFDEWLSVHMQGIGDRPEGTFVALAGNDVVGWANLSFWDAKPDTPFHDLTGVKRAWRGQGVARALKHAQLNWAKAQGYRALRTAMVDRNEPIRRLNAELGYRPIRGRVYLGRPTSGSPPPPAPVA